MSLFDEDRIAPPDLFPGRDALTDDSRDGSKMIKNESIGEQVNFGARTVADEAWDQGMTPYTQPIGGTPTPSDAFKVGLPHATDIWFSPDQTSPDTDDAVDSDFDTDDD